MTESEPPVSIEPGETQPSSLGGRLVNVFVSPTEVFDEVKACPPQAANWIVPLVIAIVVGVIYTVVIFSQGQVIQGIRDTQEKQFQKMVDSGKLTQKQADDQLAMVEKFMTPAIFKTIGVISAVIMSAVMLCLVALYIWLLGAKAFHGNFDYVKAMEVVGLTTMIGVLDGIVSMCLVVIYGQQQMNLGPVMLISHFEATNKAHLLLAAFDVINLWYLMVLSIGMARLSRTSFLKSAMCVFGAWAVMKAVPLLVMMVFGGTK